MKPAMVKALSRWAGESPRDEAADDFYTSLCDIFICTGRDDPDLICMDYLEIVKTEMRPLLDNKPSAKQVEELRAWTLAMKPFRERCVLVHNERIQQLIESRK